jgi:hypothetical protein
MTKASHNASRKMSIDTSRSLFPRDDGDDDDDSDGDIDDDGNTIVRNDPRKFCLFDVSSSSSLCIFATIMLDGGHVLFSCDEATIPTFSTTFFIDDVVMIFMCESSCIPECLVLFCFF